MVLFIFNIRNNERFLIQNKNKKWKIINKVTEKEWMQ
jgi:filamentous hemagglutinin family protein